MLLGSSWETIHFLLIAPLVSQLWIYKALYDYGANTVLVTKYLHSTEGQQKDSTEVGMWLWKDEQSKGLWLWFIFKCREGICAVTGDEIRSAQVVCIAHTKVGSLVRSQDRSGKLGSAEAVSTAWPLSCRSGPRQVLSAPCLEAKPQPQANGNFSLLILLLS